MQLLAEREGATLNSAFALNRWMGGNPALENTLADRFARFADGVEGEAGRELVRIAARGNPAPLLEEILVREATAGPSANAPIGDLSGEAQARLELLDLSPRSPRRIAAAQELEAQGKKALGSQFSVNGGVETTLSSELNYQGLDLFSGGANQLRIKDAIDNAAVAAGEWLRRPTVNDGLDDLVSSPSERARARDSFEEMLQRDFPEANALNELNKKRISAIAGTRQAFTFLNTQLTTAVNLGLNNQAANVLIAATERFPRLEGRTVWDTLSDAEKTRVIQAIDAYAHSIVNVVNADGVITSNIAIDMITSLPPRPIFSESGGLQASGVRIDAPEDVAEALNFGALAREAAFLAQDQNLISLANAAEAQSNAAVRLFRAKNDTEAEAAASAARDLLQEVETSIPGIFERAGNAFVERQQIAANTSAVARDMLFDRYKDNAGLLKLATESVASNPSLLPLAGTDKMGLVKGYRGTQGRPTFGVLHIADRHPVMLNRVGDVMTQGRAEANSKGGYNLTMVDPSDSNVRLTVVLGTTWNGQPLLFPVTAYRSFAVSPNLEAVSADALKAAQTIRAVQSGQRLRVVDNEDVGPISLRWGEKIGNNGYGLSAIDPAVDPYLGELLSRGKIVPGGQLGKSSVIETANARGVVTYEFSDSGKMTAWLHSASLKKSSLPSPEGSVPVSEGSLPTTADLSLATVRADTSLDNSISGLEGLSSDDILVVVQDTFASGQTSLSVGADSRFAAAKSIVEAPAQVAPSQTASAYRGLTNQVNSLGAALELAPQLARDVVSATRRAVDIIRQNRGFGRLGASQERLNAAQEKIIAAENALARAETREAEIRALIDLASAKRSAEVTHRFILQEAAKVTRSPIQAAFLRSAAGESSIAIQRLLGERRGYTKALRATEVTRAAALRDAIEQGVLAEEALARSRMRTNEAIAIQRAGSNEPVSVTTDKASQRGLLDQFAALYEPRNSASAFGGAGIEDWITGGGVRKFINGIRERFGLSTIDEVPHNLIIEDREEGLIIKRYAPPSLSGQSLLQPFDFRDLLSAASRDMELPASEFVEEALGQDIINTSQRNLIIETRGDKLHIRDASDIPPMAEWGEFSLGSAPEIPKVSAAAESSEVGVTSGQPPALPWWRGAWEGVKLVPRLFEPVYGSLRTTTGPNFRNTTPVLEDTPVSMAVAPELPPPVPVSPVSVEVSARVPTRRLSAYPVAAQSPFAPSFAPNTPTVPLGGSGYVPPADVKTASLNGVEYELTGPVVSEGPQPLSLDRIRERFISLFEEGELGPVTALGEAQSLPGDSSLPPSETFFVANEPFIIEEYIGPIPEGATPVSVGKGATRVDGLGRVNFDGTVVFYRNEGVFSPDILSRNPNRVVAGPPPIDVPGVFIRAPDGSLGWLTNVEGRTTLYTNLSQTRFASYRPSDALGGGAGGKPPSGGGGGDGGSGGGGDSQEPPSWNRARCGTWYWKCLGLLGAIGGGYVLGDLTSPDAQEDTGPTIIPPLPVHKNSPLKILNPGAGLSPFAVTDPSLSPAEPAQEDGEAPALGQTPGETPPSSAATLEEAVTNAMKEEGGLKGLVPQYDDSGKIVGVKDQDGNERPLKDLADATGYTGPLGKDRPTPPSSRPGTKSAGDDKPSPTAADGGTKPPAKAPPSSKTAGDEKAPSRSGPGSSAGPFTGAGSGGSSSGGGFLAGGMSLLNSLLQGFLAWWNGQPVESETPRPAQPSQPTTPPPKIEGTIVASLSIVDRGETTQLAWSSVGTDSGPLACAVIDDDYAVIKRAGQSGTTTSPVLYESTRFGLVCNVHEASDKLLSETLVRVHGDSTDPPPIFSTASSTASGQAGGSSNTGGQGNAGGPSGGGSSGGPSTGGGGGGQSGNPTPEDIRTCDPDQPIDSFIRCLCEAEPNPAGCTIPPGGLPER